MSRCCTAWLLLALLMTTAGMWPARARANAAQTRGSGALTAEPEIPAPQVRIDHETLVIDLRGATGRGASAHIGATYALVNDGVAVVVPVRFVSAGSVTAVVQLDGRPIPTAASPEPIPEAWRRSARSGSRVLDPHRDAVAFTLAIEPGPHTLSVEYTTNAGWVDEPGEQAKSVDYLLAPARPCGGFGVLHVRVLAPAGMEVTANVELQELDGALQGTFNGLPVDMLTIEARDVEHWPMLLRIFLAIVGLLGVVGWFRWLPRVAARYKATPGVAAFVLGVGWAAAFMTWLYGFTILDAEAIYDVIFMGPLVSLVIAIFTAVVVVGYAREARDADSSEPP